MYVCMYVCISPLIICDVGIEAPDSACWDSSCMDAYMCACVYTDSSVNVCMCIVYAGHVCDMYVCMYICMYVCELVMRKCFL